MGTTESSGTKYSGARGPENPGLGYGLYHVLVV